jgi:hypothetical protein
MQIKTIKITKKKTNRFNGCFQLAALGFFGLTLISNTGFRAKAVLAEESSLQISKTSVIENIKIQKQIIIDPELTGDYETRKNRVLNYLAAKGETEMARWEKVIKSESGFNPSSKAPTFWSLCDRAVSVKLWGKQQPKNRFVELRDYPNKIWQTTCEENGAKTLRTGVSGGLTHILDITWESNKCEGDKNNWMAQLDCSIKIKNKQGWRAWTRN